MKKTLLRSGLGLMMVMAILFGASCSGQKSFYVSAQGDDANKGTSEKTPFKTLGKAITAASVLKGECPIIVIGTLNVASEGEQNNAVFVIGQTGEAVITITGKADAKDGEQAVLNGANQDFPVLRIEGAAGLRLENIEISGASESNGVTVSGGAAVTLGKGVKIANNSGVGIYVEEQSTLVMEGGEISGNQNRGVFIAKDCTFTLVDGTISHNTKSNEWKGGGGVYSEGTFIMEGGEISENQANSPGRGGGVFIMESVFTLKGGKIINNKSVGYSRNGGVGNGGAGGVYISGDTAGKTQFVMEGGEISGNTADRFGGGVLLGTDQGEKGGFTMTGGTITGNTGRGAGGIQNYGNRFTFNVNGGTISGNTPNDTDEGWNW